MLSSTQFPSSNQIKEEAGLPWGALITPLAQLGEGDRQTERKASVVARCSQCFGYVNPYCKFRQHTWRCSLCYASNTTPAHYEKYLKNDPRSGATLPELGANCIEYVVAENDGGAAVSDDADSSVLEFPSYVFLVDLSSHSPAFLDLVKSALQAALEGLSDMCWVGLAVFSTRLGMYDLRSKTPHVRYCRLSPAGVSGVSLTDVAGPLDIALVRLDQHKDNIALAIESLSLHSFESTNGAKRGFGGALQALVSYMSSEPVNARLMVFLGGRPDYGLGTLNIRKAENAEPQTAFYRQQAEKAARAGIGIDMFVVSSMSYVDLSSLKYLSLLTGGTLMLYDTAEDSSLPQDLYRQLATPHSFRGLLRLRTSSEFQVSSVYGHMTPDPRFERLFHVGVCTSRKTFVCDFEFTSTAGFGHYLDSRPVMQMAFAYTQLEETTGSDNADSSIRSSGSNSEGRGNSGGEVERRTWRMVRRLRIHTVQAAVAPSIKLFYLSVRPDVVLCMLTQQLIQHTIEKGIDAARISLQDWLVSLHASYHQHVVGFQFKNKEVGPVDLDFSDVDRLEFLPRYVFALLKHKLLSENCAPDQRVFLQCLLSCLPATELGRCVYPNLKSFANPDLSNADLLYLTSGSLSQGSIFLLDGFVSLIVYYTARAIAEGFVFPPPHTSAVRATVNALKANNLLIAPRVLYLREGEAEAEVFHQHLIEDKAIMGLSFVEFQQLVIAAELRHELTRRADS